MSKLWGGRFSKETSDLVDEFNASIGFDYRLWEHDIEGSVAHARMLGKCGIISQDDADRIVAGLQEIAKDIGEGKVEFDISAEDIHMNIEKLLHERIGEVAGCLHTARSRNDQIALDLRMYVKAEVKEISAQISALQETLISAAERHVKTYLSGYTHLQHAQPVSLAHHLLAYVWMLQRDNERLADCYRRTDVMPLGSAALAGTTYPIDREFVAEQLGFSKISENSMDAVSDRDFAVEFLSAASIIGMHLSRFAEEIIIWNTREFGFVELDDSVATGSSIMPQKKNPDVAELIRAKTGRLYGNLTGLLTVLKGLPLTYNKDLQEDKEPVFDTVDTLKMCIPLFGKVIETTEFKIQAMAKSLEGDFSLATDLADYLVKRGLPFRTAHEIIGRMVKYCLDEDKPLESLSLNELQEFSPEFKENILQGGIEQSVLARNIPGGTSEKQVLTQLDTAKKIIGELI